MQILKLLLALFGFSLARHAHKRKQYRPRRSERHDWD